MQTPQHEVLNYVEFAAHDLTATKAFFRRVFDWHFEDYGDDYCAFIDPALQGGFYRAAQCSRSDKGGALLVFYSKDLEATQAKIEQAGGTIVKEIFAFPGGRRFHFAEPSVNELAVWTDQGL